MNGFILGQNEYGATMLTNDRLSSGPVPVLRVIDGSRLDELGPGDFYMNPMLAADLVRDWAAKQERTEDEIKMAERFLNQLSPQEEARIRKENEEWVREQVSTGRIKRVRVRDLRIADIPEVRESAALLKRIFLDD